MAVVRVQLVQHNIQKLLDRVGATELNRRADNVLAEIRATAPVGDPRGSDTPGTLRNSFRKTNVQTTRDGRQIRIFSTATRRGFPYALAVVRGARAHVIVPKSGRLLKFFWANRGVTFIGPIVHHPGNAPNNFLRAALRAFRR